jgi:hypothetical protein
MAVLGGARAVTFNAARLRQPADADAQLFKTPSVSVDRRLGETQLGGGNLQLRVPTTLPTRIPPTKRYDDYLRSLTVTAVTLVMFLLSAGLFLSAAIMN